MKQIVSVGIDVSKGKSTVCAMIHPNTIIKESFEVLHLLIFFSNAPEASCLIPPA